MSYTPPIASPTYTPPTGNGVAISFSGAYTPPVSTAANMAYSTVSFNFNNGSYSAPQQGVVMFQFGRRRGIYGS